jgi:hypothetical protein
VGLLGVYGRGIILAEDKIEHVLNKLNLKKTLASK